MGAERNAALEEGSTPVPLIAMNFPAPVAQELLEKLLIPYAHEQQCIVGIEPYGAELCVTACCFIALAKFVPIFSAAVKLPEPSAHPTIYEYLIGTVAAAEVTPDSALDCFIRARKVHNRFYFTCGAINPTSGELSLETPAWNLPFEKMQGKGVVSRFQELKS